jgi:ATP-dependent RNA helicase RhlE
MSFTELNLIRPLLLALENKNYVSPTPIQQQSIPQILAGKDLLGCAQTGTGKTAAFALPLLQLLAEKQQKGARKTIKALILAPTRELALQISDNFNDYSKHLDLVHTTIFGGVSQGAQTRTLAKGVDILVATPGRLLDLMAQGFIKLNNVEHFVLDEADRMLDMGFIRDIHKIIAQLPSKKQTLFFSATLAPEIKKLAEKLLVKPAQVSVNPVSSTAPLIDQKVYYVSKEDKRALLSHILQDQKMESVLVFTRTKRGADRVVKDLTKTGVNAEAIHGNKSQNARERALKGFRNRTVRVLVATDIASRGIDIDKLSHVINYELPEQAETYVHRIGRTGRAGVSGTAMSFCTREERPYLKDISKLINKNIDIVPEHPFNEQTINKTITRPAFQSGTKQTTK